MMKYIVLLALVTLLFAKHTTTTNYPERHKEKNLKSMVPKYPFQRTDEHQSCQTFLTNNLLLAGQLDNGQNQVGAFFFGKVYSASTPTVLSNAQLHLDIRPTCQVGQNCTLTGTFDQQANPTYSSFIGLQVYLIRVRQSSSAPNPGDFMPITVTGNQLPGGNPNQNVDFTSISGPLYDRMEEVIYAQTYNADNMRGPTDYVLDYCVANDPRWQDNGVRVNAGDTLWMVIQAGSTQNTFQAYGGWNFNGHFNWDIRFAQNN